MKRFAILLLVATSAVAGDGSVRRTTHPVPNTYIVVLQPDTTSSRQTADALTRQHGGGIMHTFSFVFPGFSAQMPDAIAQRMSADPRVLAVYESGLVTPAETQSPAEWGLDRVDQRPAVVSGAAGSYTYGSAAGSRIYIIDTGVNNHPDLNGKIFASMNFVTVENRVDDCYSHGTYVASKAVGTTVGVAKDAQIVNVRVVPCRGIAPADAYLVAGIDWMIQQVQNAPSQRAVGNISLTVSIPAGQMRNAPVEDAVKRALDFGIPMVLGAGNESTDACNVSPARMGNPANIPNNPSQRSAITVAA
jgi:hypothetical protein